MESNLVDIVKDFFSVLAGRASSEELVRFYHPYVLQIEYPNTLTRNLTKRGLAELKAASDRGLQVLQKEEYEITNAFCSGNTVIVEVIWRGTLNIPLGTIEAGGEMKAYFAQFFEFDGDKIIHQRNYDCFEPFA